MISTAQAAKSLKVSHRRVLALIQAKRLPALKVAGRYVISSEALRQFERRGPGRPANITSNGAIRNGKSPSTLPAVSSTELVVNGTHAATGAAWRIYCGDAKKTLKGIEDSRYACVITSPPYFWQRDYGVEGQLGVERTVEDYVTNLCEVMDEVRRVLRPNGVLFLNLGDTYYSGKGKPQGKDRKHNGRRFSMIRAVDASGLGPPKKTLLGMPWRVALAMVDRGWILRSSIIWRRKRAVPESSVRDRPWRTHELIFLFAKKRDYKFNRRPLRRAGEEDVWVIESQSKAGRQHPAVFPRAIAERCLEVGNPLGGRVLDPFAGSGTVLKVALAKGIDADGIDLSPPFFGALCSELRKVSEAS